MTPFQTPVLLIVFNRPKQTAALLARLAQIRPATLHIVADGPRPNHPDDGRLCAETRALFRNLPWPCDVQTDFAPHNRGLADRVSSGITRFFGEVDHGIILEDDALPEPTFFRFCEELLHRYADDERIMSISGATFRPTPPRDGASYYFSRYTHCWGWATWRRAWHHYDHQMALWPQVRATGLLENMLPGEHQAIRTWRRMFDRVCAGRVNSWATRWMLACWLQGGLAILPAHNLVGNTGLGPDSTNTRWQRRDWDFRTHPLDFPLRHPRHLVRDHSADLHTYGRVYHYPLWRLAWQKAGVLWHQVLRDGR